jgi:hypothetical protein
MTVGDPQVVDNPADPDVLVVSGMLDRSGGGELHPLYRNAHGIATPSQGQLASARLVDARGNVVAEVGFDASFERGARCAWPRRLRPSS